MKITTVGLDLAKNVFQVHAVDSLGGTWTRQHLVSAVRQIDKQPRFKILAKDLLTTASSVNCPAYTDLSLDLLQNSSVFRPKAVSSRPDRLLPILDVIRNVAEAAGFELLMPSRTAGWTLYFCNH